MFLISILGEFHAYIWCIVHIFCTREEGGNFTKINYSKLFEKKVAESVWEIVGTPKNSVWFSVIHYPRRPIHTSSSACKRFQILSFVISLQYRWTFFMLWTCDTRCCWFFRIRNFWWCENFSLRIFKSFRLWPDEKWLQNYNINIANCEWFEIQIEQRKDFKNICSS